MKTTKTAKEKLAGLVRVISIPPVMVTALLLILYFWGPQPFCPVGELVTTILLLGFVPVLAYPAQPLFPRYRSRGREGQRELAFVFTGDLRKKGRSLSRLGQRLLARWRAEAFLSRGPDF